ncbi:MAG: branched-chain amino acid ABC transporter permease [Pseudomonadota bacterium]
MIPRATLAWGAGLLLLAALPQLAGSDYLINLASQLLIAALFAASLNLVLGYGGLLSFGHTAFFGGAAYVAALATVRLGWPAPAAALAGLLAAVVLAGGVGAIALRANGIGLAMITLALGQVCWGVAFRWVAVTEGENGIAGTQRPQLAGWSLDSPRAYYWLALAVTVFLLWLLKRLLASPYGASLRGTRDQARRMSALGYDVWLIRWLAFLYSGLMAGVAGLLFLYYHKFVSPHVLSLAESAEVLLMVVTGGAGTFWGPLVGAVIVMLFKNVASSYIESWLMLLGVLFVLIVLFMPDGVVPGLQRLLSRARAAARRSP